MPVRKNTRVLQIDSNGQSSSARLVKSPSIRWWRSLSMATGAAVEASRPRAWIQQRHGQLQSGAREERRRRQSHL